VLKSFWFFVFISFVFPHAGLASGSPTSFSSLAQIRKQFHVPGLGVASLKVEGTNRFIHTEVTGIKSSGSGSNLNPDDLFFFGSGTKSVTALLIAIAVQEGKLNYQSTLRELLPNEEIDSSLQEVTLEHLLVHTSGIGGDLEFDEVSDQVEERKARALLIKEILQVQAKALPGLQFEYSDPGYVLLGHLLEWAYDRSFRDLVEERLFSPLGMSSCGIALSPKGFGPAGGVQCSLQDWMKFAALHIELYQERSDLLNPEIARLLYRAINPEGYTLSGWVTTGVEENRVLYFEGSTAFNFAAILVAPGLDRAFAATSNVGGRRGEEATREALKFEVKLKRPAD
jgi:CubicO group peptidase (beta-lactamase class C family)